jgi:hypothetical protein
MIGCRCPGPPCDGHGGSRRSSCASADLSRRGMSRRVLDLRTLRSRSAVLQSRLSRRRPASAATSRQPPLPAESRRPTGSSRPATGIPAPPVSDARDGSIFRGDPFSGTIAMWEQRGNAASRIEAVRRPGLSPSTLDSPAVLCHLRPAWRLGRPVPAHSQIPMVEAHDQSRDPR